MNVITEGKEHFDQVFEKVHLGQGEILSGRFEDCKFVECVFESAELTNCIFSGCIFQECNLSLVQVTGTSFPSARFQNTKLIGVDWTRGNWSQNDFSQLDGFFDSVLSHSTFIGLKLKGIQIEDCVAHEVDFREADLSAVSFRGTDLAKSLFNNTNLTTADLSRARNYQIDPENNVLKKAKFSLPEAMGLLYSMDIEIIEQDDSVL